MGDSRLASTPPTSPGLFGQMIPVDASDERGRYLAAGLEPPSSTRPWPRPPATSGSPIHPPPARRGGRHPGWSGPTCPIRPSTTTIPRRRPAAALRRSISSPPSRPTGQGCSTASPPATARPTAGDAARATASTSSVRGREALRRPSRAPTTRPWRHLGRLVLDAMTASGSEETCRATRPYGDLPSAAEALPHTAGPAASRGCAPSSTGPSPAGADRADPPGAAARRALACADLRRRLAAILGRGDALRLRETLFGAPPGAWKPRPCRESRRALGPVRRHGHGQERNHPGSRSLPFRMPDDAIGPP